MSVKYKPKLTIEKDGSHFYKTFKLPASSSIELMSSGFGVALDTYLKDKFRTQEGDKVPHSARPHNIAQLTTQAELVDYLNKYFYDKDLEEFYLNKNVEISPKGYVIQKKLLEQLIQRNNENPEIFHENFINAVRDDKFFQRVIEPRLFSLTGGKSKNPTEYINSMIIPALDDIEGFDKKDIFGKNGKSFFMLPYETLNDIYQDIEKTYKYGKTERRNINKDSYITDQEVINKMADIEDKVEPDDEDDDELQETKEIHGPEAGGPSSTAAQPPSTATASAVLPFFRPKAKDKPKAQPKAAAGSPVVEAVLRQLEGRPVEEITELLQATKKQLQKTQEKLDDEELPPTGAFLKQLEDEKKESIELISRVEKKYNLSLSFPEWSDEDEEDFQDIFTSPQLGPSTTPPPPPSSIGDIPPSIPPTVLSTATQAQPDSEAAPGPKAAPKVAPKAAAKAAAVAAAAMAAAANIPEPINKNFMMLNRSFYPNINIYDPLSDSINQNLKLNKYLGNIKI